MSPVAANSIFLQSGPAYVQLRRGKKAGNGEKIEAQPRRYRLAWLPAWQEYRTAGTPKSKRIFA
jgi:hypothetical protein